MQNIKTLIDKAAKVCGSQTALSKRLKIHRSRLSDIKNGHAPMPPAMAILIADIAMENVADAALAAIVQNEEGTERGEQIKAVLGKVLLAGALGLSLITHSQAATGVNFAMDQVQKTINKIYIVECSLRKKATDLRQWLFSLLKMSNSFECSSIVNRPILHPVHL